jgi:hypothetical protein
LYYTVTEGRARALDRLNLRDRATYGLDWMVLEATNARDAVRQWQLFKAGTHPRQGELEAEAARYRVAAPGGYAAPWEAEAEAVGLRAADTVRALDARSQELREEQADLEKTRQSLTRLTRLTPGASAGAVPKRKAPARAKTRRSTVKKKGSARQPPARQKRRQRRRKGR